MKLPEKYKGAMDGPYHAESIWTKKGMRHAIIPTGCVDVLALTPTHDAKSGATADLLADAPMLACRVAEITNALEEASTALMAAANALHQAGFKVLSEATWEQASAANRALSASPFGLVADKSQEARAAHGEQAV